MIWDAKNSCPLAICPPTVPENVLSLLFTLGFWKKKKKDGNSRSGRRTYDLMYSRVFNITTSSGEIREKALGG